MNQITAHGRILAFWETEIVILDQIRSFGDVCIAELELQFYHFSHMMFLRRFDIDNVMVVSKYFNWALNINELLSFGYYECILRMIFLRIFAFLFGLINRYIKL